MLYIGVDLGQKEDHTAIAIVERPDLPRGYQAREYQAALRMRAYRAQGDQARPAVSLLVRRVQRVALGTPYPRVVEIVREIARGQAFAGQCAVVVDGTGVGAPVVDMLRAAGLGCEITAVTITGGEREPRQGSLNVGVPKRDLICGSAVGTGEGRDADCAAHERRGRAGAGTDGRADHRGRPSWRG